MSDQDGSKKRKATAPIDIPTTSSPDPKLPPWVAGGSPAKFVTKDEILKISQDLEDLTLVHEIAIDPNFSIAERPKDAVAVAVKENMMKAYWDLLQEDLIKSPPEYEHAFNMLLDIKKMILEDILTVQHVRLRAEVEAVLSENSLRNKMEQECLDVSAIATFIVNLLGRLCAMGRDQMVEKLKKTTDVVALIKGIFELIEVMKDDLTNYKLSQNRAAVEEYSAKYEYQQFQKLMEKDPSASELTREWLSKAYKELFGVEREEAPKKEQKRDIERSDGVLVDTTSRAYVWLVQEESPALFPETMEIDKLRIKALSEKFLQIIVTASCVFVTCNIAGREISESTDFKKNLKNHLVVIANDIDEKNLEKTLDQLASQCQKEVKDTAEKLKVPYTAETADTIKQQVKLLFSKHNAIRRVVFTRVSTFLEEMLRSPNTVPHRLLPGLSVIQSELCAFTARYLRLCVHNRKTYYELYHSLILEFQIDHGGYELDTSNCKEASPNPYNLPGPSGLN